MIRPCSWFQRLNLTDTRELGCNNNMIKGSKFQDDTVKQELGPLYATHSLGLNGLGSEDKGRT